MANDIEIVVKLRDIATQGLNRIGSTVTSMGSRISSALGSAISTTLRWTTALAGLGGAVSAIKFVNLASDIEDLRGRLSGVFEGDLKAGADQLERIRAMAADPLIGTEKLADVFIKGSTAVKGFGEDTLETLANVAVQFDADINTVYSAFAGAQERALRQLGVSIEKSGDIVRITSGNIRLEVADTKEAIQQGLIELWGKRFPDAVDQAAARFSGKKAILIDEIEDIGAAVGERMLPRIGQGFDAVTRLLKDNEARFESWADSAAAAFDDVGGAVLGLAETIGGNVGPAIAAMVQTLGGLNANIGLTVNLAKMLGESFDGLPDTLSWTSIFDQFAEDMRKAAAAADATRAAFDIAGINAERATLANEQLAKAFEHVQLEGISTEENYAKLNAELDHLLSNSIPLTRENQRLAESYGLVAEAVKKAAAAAPTIPAFAGGSSAAAAAAVSPSKASPLASTEQVDTYSQHVSRLADQIQRVVVAQSEMTFPTEQATTFSEKVSAAWQNARQQLAITDADYAAFAQNISGGIKQGFLDDLPRGLVDVINKTKSFGDAWRSVGSTIAQQIQLIIAKLIALRIASAFTWLFAGAGSAGGSGAQHATDVLNGSGAGLQTFGQSVFAPPRQTAPVYAPTIQVSVQFHAGFVDPRGGDEFIGRNQKVIGDVAVGAVYEALDRFPAFKGKVTGS